MVDDDLPGDLLLAISETHAIFLIPLDDAGNDADTPEAGYVAYKIND